MARIVITRPNGETEYAELTTDKAQAGNDHLTVNKDGTTYYAKLDSGVSTHMFVIKPDGRKLYVQKEVKFIWEYQIDAEWEKASKMVIPRTGKYKITFKQEESDFEPDNIVRTRTVTEVAIFEQGARFEETQYAQYIKAKNGDKYQLEFIYEYGIPESEEFEGIRKTITKIEYIGEA